MGGANPTGVPARDWAFKCSFDTPAQAWGSSLERCTQVHERMSPGGHY